MKSHCMQLCCIDFDTIFSLLGVWGKFFENANVTNRCHEWHEKKQEGSVIRFRTTHPYFIHIYTHAQPPHFRNMQMQKSIAMCLCVYQNLWRVFVGCFRFPFFSFGSVILVILHFCAVAVAVIHRMKHFLGEPTCRHCVVKFVYTMYSHRLPCGTT